MNLPYIQEDPICNPPAIFSIYDVIIYDYDQMNLLSLKVDLRMRGVNPFSSLLYLCSPFFTPLM